MSDDRKSSLWPWSTMVNLYARICFMTLWSRLGSCLGLFFLADNQTRADFPAVATLSVTGARVQISFVIVKLRPSVPQFTI
jgi:hypothetical protein